jgi:bifunctional UDP-N-acetylglucosamine pyrophosphorylase / glucosamine-1-phosphate N-acetyltransferase
MQPAIPYRVSAVILAAGRGSRMHSAQAKVLHPLGGKALVQHVIDTAWQLPLEYCYLIYGQAGEQLQAHLGSQRLQWVQQISPRGTGDAVRQVLPYLQGEQAILILYGDVPLITPETLRKLLHAKPAGGISLLTAEVADPTGYGRICRFDHQVVRIVEHQEADSQQQQILEINSGILVVDVADLQQWLGKLSNHNAVREFYLTDIIALAHAEGRPIHTVQPAWQWEISGVNDRQQLAQLERRYQLLKAERLLRAGVTLSDPSRFDLRGELIHGQDVFIDSNVLLQGRVVLGDRVTLGVGSILSDCTIGDDCHIKPYTLIEDSRLGNGCTVGPFARLRPGNELQAAASIGNFIELKQCQIGAGSKAGHFGYLGNAEIGAGVNIGAGTITCNYNGADKLKTVLGDGVFIGAGSQLVAPISIGDYATIGAGTTVTQDVSQEELVICRAPQKHIQGWQRPGRSGKKR